MAKILETDIIETPDLDKKSKSRQKLLEEFKQDD